MVVSDSQRWGVAAVLTISLIFYGASELRSRLAPRENPLPWGDQQEDTLAVEVSNSRGESGIYFLRDKGGAAELGQIMGIPGAGGVRLPEGGPILPGSTLSVSLGGEIRIGEMTAAKKLALGLPLDINRASEADLALVPGIGERTAFSIVELRHKTGPFRELSELMAVPGIKEKKLGAIGRYVTIRRTP
jgi:competence protein ComEA